VARADRLLLELNFYSLRRLLMHAPVCVCAAWARNRREQKEKNAPAAFTNQASDQPTGVLIYLFFLALQNNISD
jgi:hypothetical protein